MEALISLDGYILTEKDSASPGKSLLDQFYEKKGYTIVSTDDISQAAQPKAQQTTEALTATTHR
jgi:hypothetical protein